ncbi:MAG: tRNA (N6-isopentenyl adenosine(37)-C2)-methylthiotransferase MiaB, partial [Robiginitalea sp.]
MEKLLKEELQGTALNLKGAEKNTRKLYIESYVCQMNFSDSEIVASILTGEGFNTTQHMEEAD